MTVLAHYLAGLALLMSGALPPGGTFVDDDASVHQGYIEAIAEAGITKGCNPPTNNRFCPEDSLTRAEMAAFLSRALDLPEAPTDYFEDDQGHVLEEAVNSVAHAGIVKGCNPPQNTAFCPDSPTTRGQMAVMLVRALGYPPAGVDYFEDDDQSLYESSINALAAQKVTLGCNPPENDRYCPDRVVTRAQTASLLARALELDPIHPPPRLKEVVTLSGRDTWGAAPAETNRMVPHTIRFLTIHHAGTQSGTTGPAQFRSWQNWHMNGRGWPDLAYHMIVSIDGTVYQGRDPAYRGDTGTNYDPTGHFLVVVEGNFNVDYPTPAQIEALTKILAWAAIEYDVPVSTIAGHRDHASTECPGDHLHQLITSGELGQSVTQLIDSGGVELIWP